MHVYVKNLSYAVQLLNSTIKTVVGCNEKDSLYEIPKCFINFFIEIIKMGTFNFVGQCESMSTVERKLQEMGIIYVKTRVEEGGIHVDQLFFHDPDGLMIEICNCDNLPVVPLTGETVRSCSKISCNVHQQQQIKQQQQEVQINQ